MSPLALIGLGSNLGDRRAILDGAVEELRRRPDVNFRAVSPYHETKPVGGPLGQGPFLNAAATLEPTIDPRTLLGLLREVEQQFGRDRTVRWGERTLDLDLLLFGEEVVFAPDLVLPHPRFAFRRFVLAPSAEVAPSAIDPLTQRSVADLLANLDRRPSLVCIDDLDRDSLSPEPGILTQVHQRVIEGLDGLGLTKHGVPIGRCPPSDPWKWHYRRVAELARSLSTRRWEAPTAPEQWLIADFSLTQEMLRGATALGRATRHGQRRPGLPIGLGRAQYLAGRAVRESLSPTLVVLIPRSGGTSTPDRRFLDPLLIPESHEPAAIAEEILTACAATRN